jgi:transposase DDE domain
MVAFKSRTGGSNGAGILKLGIAADLKSCFGPLASKILSVAYYLISEEGQPMYRFQKWGATHKHPFNEDIPSQRMSELFSKISEDKKLEYFRKQAKRRSEKEYLAFDTTSISSYSELLKQVKYGKNKEDDDLPQINLAMLFGKRSMLPVYYRKLPGNIPDVNTIENLLKDIDFLDLEKLKLVMDRGFYSEKNINDLMKHHHKFLIGVKTSLKIVGRHLNQLRDDLVTRINYNSELHLYVKTFADEWDYTEEKPRLGETVTDKRRVYIHIYFNDQHCTDDRDRFNHMLDRYEDELRSGHRNPEHEKAYAKYFVLMTNGIKDPVEALRTYRLRDLIEKSFGNLKERLDMRRMSVSSEENFEGKLFVQFIALELISYIKKKMDDNHLYKNYTMQQLIDTLDIIELYQQPGKAHHLSEITEKQLKLYAALGVKAPS